MCIHLLAKKNVKVLAVLLVIMMMLFVSAQRFETHAQPKSTWTKLANGNLVAEKANGKWILHSDQAVYINMLGIRGKESALLNQDVYEAQDTQLSLNKLKKMSDVKGLSHSNTQTDFIQSGGMLFATNKQAQKNSDGNLIYSDDNNENIWKVDVNGNSTSMLDTAGLEDTKKVLKSFGDLGENNGRVIWGNKAMVSGDGKSVLFQSNRDEISNKKFDLSVYKLSDGQTVPTKILDSRKYKQNITLFDVKNNIVVGYLSHGDTLITYDLNNGTEKVLDVKGHPEALSPDGTKLLIRMVINDDVQSDFYAIDLQTNSVNRIPMPTDYFYNGDGAWSPDGSKFAFYMNGYKDNDSSKDYRTNIKIGVVNLAANSITTYDKPSDSSNLYTLGAISWLENNQVIANMDDNTSWALTIE
jgi:hypothetical protein